MARTATLKYRIEGDAHSLLRGGKGLLLWTRRGCFQVFIEPERACRAFGIHRDEVWHLTIALWWFAIRYRRRG